MNRHFTLLFYVMMAFLVSGAAIWLPEYSDLSLPNALFGFPLWVIFFCALFGRWFSKHGVVVVSVAIGVAPLLAYLLRMMIDVARDPTSHNLWPVALFIAGVVSFPVAAIGSFLAWYLEALLKKYRFRKGGPPVS